MPLAKEPVMEGTGRTTTTTTSSSSSSSSGDEDGTTTTSSSDDSSSSRLDTGGSGVTGLDSVEAALQSSELAARDTWAEAAYERLVETCPTMRAKKISTGERDRRALFEGTLTYGEIMFGPFAATLRKIRTLYGGLRARGGKFVDLGSGSGKPVFAAALLHDWDSLVGIELLDGLHAVSLELLERWRSPQFQASLLESAGGGGGGGGEGGEEGAQSHSERGRVPIDFIKGDITKVDWSDADFVFANSTCYNEPLMLALAAASEAMRPGSFAVTFTKRLPSGMWQVLESQIHTMTWGSATVYIHRKMFAGGRSALMGVTPAEAASSATALARDTSQRAKLRAVFGPLATLDSVALDFTEEGRKRWFGEGGRGRGRGGEAGGEEEEEGEGQGEGEVEGEREGEGGAGGGRGSGQY